jgi:hypothetical protein
MGVDVSFDLGSSQSTETSTSDRNGTADEFRSMWKTPKKAQEHMDKIGGVPGGFEVTEESTTTTTTITGTVGVDLSQQRKGKQHTVNEQIDTESLGDRIVSREVIQFMRARNIEFTSTRLKPFTEVYPFFDNVDVARFCMPKLVEIEMISGTFQVEEAVAGIMPSEENTEDDEESTRAAIVARVATTNHKYGPYNRPTDIFERNPYNRSERIPETYSETSTVLNIDTFSLG